VVRHHEVLAVSGPDLADGRDQQPLRVRACTASLKE
jgi:hypothetical protein